MRKMHGFGLGCHLPLGMVGYAGARALVHQPCGYDSTSQRLCDPLGLSKQFFAVQVPYEVNSGYMPCRAARLRTTQQGEWAVLSGAVLCSSAPCKI